MYARAASLGSVLLASGAFLGANPQTDGGVPTIAPAGAFAPALVRPVVDSAPELALPIAPRQHKFVYQIEGAGVVEVRRVTGGLAFGQVTPADGWTWEPDDAGAPLSGTFSNGTTTLLLMIVEKDESLEAIAIEVGSGDSAGSETSTPRAARQPTTSTTSRPANPPATSPTTSPVQAAPATNPVAEPVTVATPTTKPVPTTQPAPTTEPSPTTQPEPTTKPVATTSPVTTEKPEADRNDKNDSEKSDRESKRRDHKSDRDDDKNDRDD